MRPRTIAGCLLLALLTAGATGSAALTAAKKAPVERRIGPAAQLVLDVHRGMPVPRIPNGVPIPMPSSGYQQAVLQAAGLAGAQADGLPAATRPTLSAFGCRHVFRSPGRPANIRANVDCGFRSQSEEWISINPRDPRNIIVSQNDSKLQGNRTGVEFSLDGGRHFGDSVLTNGRIRLDEVPGGEWSFDAFSDPASAFDSRGNLYYTAVGFDAFQDFFGGVFVWKSNSCLKGSVMHTPGEGGCRPFREPLNGSAVAVRTNFDNDLLSDDKEFMAADAFPDSPFRDNVYITWTIFDFSCTDDEGNVGFYCESPIFFSRSTDGGVTWSDALEISGRSETLCRFGDAFNPDLDSNKCNFSQGSYPLVGPDGTIYVAFNNGNTSIGAANGLGIAQQLLVKSTDGGLTWSDPVLIARDFALQPVSLPPDNELPNGCPAGRQCLPPNGYRMNDYPSLGIDERTGKLAAFWADFRNGGPCETVDLGFPVNVAPCEDIDNDVFAAVSRDGGETFGPARNVNRSGGDGETAQWQPWGDVGEDGKLQVAYYDRKYGDCEASGCNDITLSTSANGGRTWAHRRITTSSMPNLTCENNPEQCGFLGDYMSTMVAHGRVHMVWGDTRGRGLPGGVPEEDIYYATVRP